MDTLISISIAASCLLVPVALLVYILNGAMSFYRTIRTKKEESKEA